jgi:hypothetical protein
MAPKLYFNADENTRNWGGIQLPDGAGTLILAPGEERELDLPDDFHDAYLKPREATKPATVDELRAQAAAAGLEIPAKATKAEILAAIAGAEEATAAKTVAEQSSPSGNPDPAEAPADTPKE